MTIGMLVKVGDVWIDPLAVECVYDGESGGETTAQPHFVVDEAKGAEEVLSYVSGLRLSVDHGSAYGYTVTAEEATPVCTVIAAEGEYVCEGVTADEAAAIINRCREQHIGGRETRARASYLSGYMVDDDPAELSNE